MSFVARFHVETALEYQNVQQFPGRTLTRITLTPDDSSANVLDVNDTKSRIVMALLDFDQANAFHPGQVVTVTFE